MIVAPENPSRLVAKLHRKQGLALLTEATELGYGGAAGGGKALALDTPIATVDGWLTMGELRAGDIVYSEDGSPTRIVAVSDVLHGRPCYEIHFSNGETIVADANHLWKTQTYAERTSSYRRTDKFRAKRRASRPSRGTGKRPDMLARNQARVWEYLTPCLGQIRTTEDIFATVLSQGRSNHSVRLGPALQCKAKKLPIEPYVLGAWLGDGHSNGGGFTTADSEILEFIRAEGFEIRKWCGPYAYGIQGLQAKLRSVGLIKNKHIPREYFRGSYKQRLALFQGLMDTDGHCCKEDGGCEFCITSQQLANDVDELMCSLGIRARKRRSKAYLRGKECADRYRFSFTTGVQVFRLKRKLERLRAKQTEDGERVFIESIKAVASVPVRCIEVEHPSGMFLAGRRLIPTHNSHLGRISAIHFAYNIPGIQIYFFRRTSNELTKNHMTGPTGFPALLAPWVRSGFVRIVKNEIRFMNGPNGEVGSQIFLCHCQHEKDVFNWLGPEMHYLIIEQAEQFTPFMIQMLRGRNRIPDSLKIPEKYRKLFPRCLYTFNPGGVGHVFFKEKFYRNLRRDADGISEIVEQPETEGGKKRQFIQAKLADNPSVDPKEYRKTLMGLPEKMRKALLDGDMNVVIGGFFPMLSRDKHLIRAFQIPTHWPKVCVMDYGACGDGDPFSIGWYAIADGTIPVHSAVTNEPMPCQRGSIICYRRWNGAGLPKMDAAQIAEGIINREHETILFRIAGGDIIENRGHGLTVFSIFQDKGLHFSRADNRRLNGWGQVDYRLNGENGYPLSFWFEECEDDLETIGSLQHDILDPQDIAKGNDHDGDRHRYMCARIPIARAAPEPAKPIKPGFATPTPKELLRRTAQKQKHAGRG